MAIYDFKEFLDIEDVAEYLADKNICNFDPREPLEKARLDNILADINITPIYKIDGTFDVEIIRMQAKDTLEIDNIGEINLDIIGYFEKKEGNSYSLVKYFNKDDFNIDILYPYLIECNIDKTQASYLAQTGQSKSINPIYFLDFKLHKTKYVTKNNELFKEPPTILEYYQKSQLDAIFNQSKITELEQKIQDLEEQLQARDSIIAALSIKPTGMQAKQGAKLQNKQRAGVNQHSHSNEALQALHDVINEFWQDPSNPPKQEFIKAHITENYPSIDPSKALWIDKIIRHKDK